jgi:hypothetical protein
VEHLVDDGHAPPTQAPDHRVRTEASSAGSCGLRHGGKDDSL